MLTPPPRRRQAAGVNGFRQRDRDHACLQRPTAADPMRRHPGAAGCRQADLPRERLHSSIKAALGNGRND